MQAAANWLGIWLPNVTQEYLKIARDNHNAKIAATPAITRHFVNQDEVFHVRVSRSSWDQPFGQLSDVSISAALQLNGRALNKLLIPAVAVGRVKVYPTRLERKWRCQRHEIVARAEQLDLEKVPNQN